MRRLLFLLVLLGPSLRAQLPDAPTPAIRRDVSGDDDSSAPDSSAPDSRFHTLTSIQNKIDLIPNERVIQPGTIAPPASADLNFVISANSSVDLPAVIGVSASALVAKALDTHPSLGKGPSGYGQYLWRGMLEQTDRNFESYFLFPTLLREDPRYYVAGLQTTPRHRLLYASTRVFVTRTYSGRPTPNIAGIAGKIGSLAISTTYYPNYDMGDVASRFASACLREAALNVLREFYPEIRARIRRKHRTGSEAVN